MIHVGKHGNLEWLPGKNLGMSASCGTDAAIGSLPLIYPFLVNDPGEGTQAKRRAHAKAVDHLVPPMARAETYGDIARPGATARRDAQVNAMDPARCWRCVVKKNSWTPTAAPTHRRPRPGCGCDEEAFDEVVLHVDDWLCEIKDAQIRDGLDVLGEARSGECADQLVLRRRWLIAQIFGG